MPKIARAITAFKRGELSPLFSRAHFVIKRQGFVVRAAKSLSESPHSRILVVIPGKYGTAPERNTVKRRLKALFYEQGWYARGYDWIWYASTRTKQRAIPRFSDLLNTWSDAWSRLASSSTGSSSAPGPSSAPLNNADLA